LINQSSPCYRHRRDFRVRRDPAVGAQERFATASVRVSNQVIRGSFSQGAKDRIDDCPKHEKKSELSQPSHTNSSMKDDDEKAPIRLAGFIGTFATTKRHALPARSCRSILVKQIRQSDRQELGRMTSNEVVQRTLNDFFGIMVSHAASLDDSKATRSGLCRPIVRRRSSMLAPGALTRRSGNG
jgi:hypothetical protein